MKFLILLSAFIALATAYFAKPLILGYPFLRGDMGDFFYPQRLFFALSVRSGDFPLWNPFLYCGFPFLAEPQNAVFYPLTWLFVLFPSPGTIWVTLILHLAIAGVGAAWLAEESTGAKGWAAFCGGMVYAFSGFFCMHAGHLNQVMTCAWTPWVFWSAIRWLSEPNRRRFITVSLLFGVQLLPGGSENTAYMCVFLVGLAVASLWRTPESTVPRRVGPAMAILGAMVLGGGLAAAQLVPTLELARYSARAGGLAYDYAAKHSMPPWKPFTDLIVPNYYGHYGPAGSRLKNIPASELAGYVGLVAVILAVVGASRNWRGWSVRFWAVTAVLALLLSFGRHTPLYQALFACGLQHFRNPSRFIFLFDLSVAVLAAGGIEALLTCARLPLRQCWHRGLATGLLLLGVGLLLLAYGPGALNINDKTAFSGLIAGDLGFTLLGLAAACLALTVCSPKCRQSLLAVSLAVPLFGFARESEFWNLSPVDPRVSEQRIDLLNEVRPHFGQDRAFAFHCPGFRPNRNMLYGIPDVSGYEGGLAPLARFYELQNRMAADSHLARSKGRRLMDLLGARVTLDDGRLTDQEDGLLATKGRERAFLNRSAVPRAVFVSEAEVVSDEAALRQMAYGEWHPQERVLLASDSASSGLANDRLDGPASARITESQNGRVVCEVTAPKPGFLVLTDTYYPGWEASVDGQPADLLRANYLFRAVGLVSGAHRVEFAFRPASLSAGAAVTVISVLVILLIPAGTRRRRTADQGPSPCPTRS